jgi:hypothetical protein
VCRDLCAGTKEFLAAGVLPDHGGCGVEVGGFGGGREDVGEEEVAYAAL